ncbi:hypothetical protein [Winogradskyella sp. SM1960]|uniref:hypothetical protein n=1 Tax=Winogradskyella sp. SM1960 TaxID=2865955 RepID=UPI001CD1D8B3|nr:hypothetical protein [Winogradskyella sp. SM1960]
MKTKLHFGLIILLLAFLGTYLEQNTLPNQQIVIQFSDDDISTKDTENAIEVIQNKLESIGVTHIQIGQKNDGELRIIYHSTTAVEHIQNALFNVEDVNIAYNSTENHTNNFPDHKNHKDYELNITEIKISNNLNWDFERTQVVEVNQKTDRFLYHKTHSSGNQFQHIENNFTIKLAVCFSRTTTIETDNNSYIIPEVRAGPIV